MKRGMWKMQPSDRLTPGMLNVMRLLSLAEPLGAAAVILGFLTQYAVIGLGIIMLGAISLKVSKWHVPYASTTVNGWELDTLNLGISAALLVSGAGAMSVDRMLGL
jgi:uncharacterized membrane protein YphA (DoxX/SURF4 family)